MPSKKEISLLVGAGSPNSLSDKIIFWISNVLRYIMVFTELIIIIIFLSRFKLDRENTDLSDRIRQQRSIIQVNANFEKEYTNLQKKIDLIGKLYKDQPDYYNKLISIIQNTPSDITFNSLALENKEGKVIITLNVFAYQEEAIIDFINQLSLNKNIKSIEVTNIEKKARENKYNIMLNIKI